MRRKRIRHLMMPPAVILILMMFFITACEANFLDNSENETFSLTEAKEYSLQNAAVINFPSTKPSSKSVEGIKLEPIWDEAKYHEINFPDKLAKTYEVPLGMSSQIVGLLLRNGDCANEPARISSSLIVQEFVQGEKQTSRQMVATIIGNDLEGEHSAAFTYMGSRSSFTGFMLVSKVSGEIINIFQYINGERTVMYLKTNNYESTNGYYRGFRFINLISTKSEYGNTIPGDCHMCGRATEVYPMYGDICAICLDGSDFLEEVVVEEERPDDTEDGGSGGGSGSHCNCWGDCECSQSGNMMCMCEPGDGPGTACSNCGELGCNGECSGGGGSGSQGEENNDDDDFPLNITLTGNAAFDTLCHNVMNVSNDLMTQVLSNVKTSQINVEMRFLDTLSTLARGELENINGSNGKKFIITFRENIKTLKVSVQRIVILHELLHLNLYLELSDNTDANYADIVGKYNICRFGYENDFNAASHEFFAAHYLDYIEDMAGVIAPDLDAGMVKWSSLTDTREFKELELAEQELILEYLSMNNL